MLCGLAAAIADAAACAPPRPPDAAAWTFRTPRPWLAGASQAVTPIVDGDSVYFCGGYGVDRDAAVHAITLADGRPTWRQPVGRCRNFITAAGGLLVVMSSRDAGARCIIEGYDPLNGSTRWQHLQDSGSCGRFAAVASDVVLVSDERNNQIMSLRASDGRLQRFDLGRPTTTDANRLWLTAAGATAWFGIDDRAWRWRAGEAEPYLALELSDGEFSVFVADSGTGQIVHTIEVDEEVTTSPVRGPGNLLPFGTISGALHAVRVPVVER